MNKEARQRLALSVLRSVVRTRWMWMENTEQKHPFEAWRKLDPSWVVSILQAEARKRHDPEIANGGQGPFELRIAIAVLQAVNVSRPVEVTDADIELALKAFGPFHRNRSESDFQTDITDALRKALAAILARQVPGAP